MMIITGNFGRTQPVKSAVKPWAQGPTTRAKTGQPRSSDGPQYTTRRYPAVPGYLRGWLGPRRLLGWLAGLYSIQTLLGAAPVGAGELGHQEDMFPFKYIFELFMFYSYFSLEQLFLNSMVLCR